MIASNRINLVQCLLHIYEAQYQFISFIIVCIYYYHELDARDYHYSGYSLSMRLGRACLQANTEITNRLLIVLRRIPPRRPLFMHGVPHSLE